MKLANVVRGDVEVAVTEIVGRVAAHKIHDTVLTSCVISGSSCTDAGIRVWVVCTIDTMVKAMYQLFIGKLVASCKCCFARL